MAAKKAVPPMPPMKKGGKPVDPEVNPKLEPKTPGKKAAPAKVPGKVPPPFKKK